MITVKPQGGLGNRMRAIDSALLIAGSTGKGIRIIWEMSFELNCSFHELFYLPDGAELYEFHTTRFHKRASGFLNKILRKSGIDLPLGYDLYLFNEDILSLKRNGTDFNHLIGSGKSVYICTVHQFFQGENSFRAFKPISSLQKRIDYYTGMFGSNTIGVHIRRSDNLQSIKHSPLEDFIDIMKDEINKNPGTLFFLATDSVQVEENLKDSFRESIITHKKLLDRNKSNGIQDALIDLYCLSKTRKIIGSYYSSFSETAAQMGNIEIRQVYRQN